MYYSAMELRRTYEDFAELASEFCKRLESSRSARLDCLIDLRRALATLYLAALDLPPVDLRGDGTLESPNLVSVAETQVLRLALSKNLEFDRYWIVYDPTTGNPEEPVSGSLADDFADIWRDLVAGLRALERDRASWEHEVWWEWRFEFETHWGVHAVDALYAMHRMLRDLDS